MSVTVAPTALTLRRPGRNLDAAAVGTWALAGGLVLILGLDGGGYDLLVRNQVGLVLWWLVLVGAAWGVLPAGRMTRAALVALGALAGFVAWTALAGTWSLSAERSLDELSRVACYLAVLVLAIGVHADRRRAVRHTVHALAAAITLVVALALASRLFPGSFPGAHATATFLPGARSRLGWPLNYWNALAALAAMGLVLLLSIATSARTLAGQAAGAAPLPAFVLCGYLTFSRGGAIAATVAVVAFIALAPQRLPKLLTLVVAATGGAILIAGAVQREAIERGLSGTAATAQGRGFLPVVILVCAGTALAQVGIGLLGRRARWPQVTPRRARVLLAAGLMAAVVAGVVLGAPSRLGGAWHQFTSTAPAARESLRHDSLQRFANLNGNSRYAYWKVAVQATRGHVLGGSGPGTFQLVWEPRATVSGYVIDAHSLYVQTLSEVGVVGLVLLVGLLLVVLGAGARAAIRSQPDARVLGAGAVAAIAAFTVSASVDWVWQMPVLPAAVLLLAGALLAPEHRANLRPRGRLCARVGAAVLALACLAAIAVPLGTVSAVRESQQAASAGHTRLALADALTAVRLAPDAATARLQEALVLEARHDLTGALVAARAATRAEPANWATWLTVSRLEAEAGHVRAAVSAYDRARRDNPRSPIFTR